MPAIRITVPTATQNPPFLPLRWPKPSPVLVVPTHGGMARLSGPGKYRQRWSPIPLPIEIALYYFVLMIQNFWRNAWKPGSGACLWRERSSNVLRRSESRQANHRGRLIVERFRSPSADQFVQSSVLPERRWTSPADHGHPSQGCWALRTEARPISIHVRRQQEKKLYSPPLHHQ